MADGAGVDLGTAYASIEVSLSQFNNELNRSLDQADRTLTSRLDTIGKNLQGVGRDLSLAFAPITGFLAAGLKEFSDYDAVLTEIEARTGATAEQMELVRSTAIRMGQDTAFSATDASTAMLELLSSGYDLNETMMALEPTLNAAAAGGLALGEAADAVTDILSQFQLGAEEAAYVADVLTKSSSASSATMQDMVMAFSNVGGQAYNFGLTLEETAAIIALFSENGIKGSEAGSELSSMLRMMSRDVPEVKATWEELGISMFDAEGNARSLDSVIKELNLAMDGMSDEERIRIIQNLAGAEGQLGLSALLAADGYAAMQEEMANSTGAAEVATKQMESFRAVIKQVKSSVLTLMLVALGPLAENYLIPAAKAVTSLVNGFTEFLVQNPAVAEALGLMILQLGIIGPLIYGFGTFMTVVAAVVGLLTSPLFILLTLLTLLVVAVRNNVLGFGDLAKGFAKTFERIRDGANVFDALVDGLGSFVDNFARALGQSYWDALKWQQTFTEAVREVESRFTGMIEVVKGWRQDLTDALQTAETKFNALVSPLSAIINLIKLGADSSDILTTAIIAIGTALNIDYHPFLRILYLFKLGATWGDILKFALIDIADALNIDLGPLNGFINLLKLGANTSDLLKIALEKIQGSLSFEGLTGGGLLAIIGRLMTLKSVVGMLGGAFGLLLTPMGLVVGLFAAFGTAYATNFLGFQDFVDNTIGEAVKGFEEIADAVGEVVKAFQKGGLKDAFAAAKEEAAGLFGSAKEGLAGFGQSFVGFIQSELPGYLSQLAGMGGKLWGWIRESLPDASFAVGEAIGQITRFVGDALVKYGPDVAAAVVGLIATVGEWLLTTGLPELQKLSQDVVIGFIDGFITGLTGKEFSIQTALQNLINGVMSGQIFVDGAVWAYHNIILPIYNGIAGYVAENGGLWNIAKNIGSTIFNGAKSGLSVAADWVSTHVITPIKNSITTGIADGTLEEKAKEIGGKIIEGAKAGLGSLTTWAWTNIISPMATAISAYLSAGTFWDTAKDIGGKLLEGAKSGLGSLTTWAWTNIISPLATAIGAYLSAGTFWDTAKDIGGKLLEGAKSGLGSLTTWAWTNVIMPLKDGIAAYLPSGSFFDTAKDIGGKLLEGAKSGLGDIATWVNDNIINPIANAISSSVGAKGPLYVAALAIGGIIPVAAGVGIGHLTGWGQKSITSPLTNLLDSFSAEGGDLWNSATTMGTNLLDGLLAGLGDIATWVQTNIVTPVKTEIENFDWATAIASGAGSVADTASSIAGAVGKGIGAVSNVASSVFGGGGGDGGGESAAPAAGTPTPFSADQMGSVDPAVVGGWAQTQIIDPLVAAITGAGAPGMPLALAATTLATNLKNAIVTGVGDIGTWFKENFLTPINDEVTTAGSAESGLYTAATTLGTNILTAAKTGMGDIAGWVQTNVTQPLTDAFTSATAAGGELYTSFVSVGEAIVDGMQAGVLARWDAFESFIMSKLASLIERVKGSLGIQSPSTVFAEMGGNIVAGLNQGVGDFGSVLNTMDTLASALQVPMDAMAGAAMQPALAAAAPAGGNGGGNTYQITVQVTPPADALAGDAQQVQQNAQLWGDTFADRLMGVFRRDE